MYFLIFNLIYIVFSVSLMYQGILFIFHAERSLIFETVVENLIGVTRKLMDLRIRISEQ